MVNLSTKMQKKLLTQKGGQIYLYLLPILINKVWVLVIN